MSEPYLYRAFISYSHRDTKWATWLLSALESYKVPQDIKAADGSALPPRLGKFFRDRDDASAATNLAEEIHRALAASQNLIVVASPHSARSPYVEQEIRDFFALNQQRETPGQILTLVADGEPAISAGEAADEGECFPYALRGGLPLASGGFLEPLAADARKTGDGKTRALAKLVSGLLGIRYDSLVRRDLQRQRQRRLWAMAAGVATVVLTGGAGLKFELDRQEKIELQRQQDQARREEEVMRAINTAERAKGLLERGNMRAALSLAQKSRNTADDLPFIPQIYDVLFTSQVQKARPVALDVGAVSGVTRDLPIFDIGGGSFLSSDGQWQAKIWSHDTGITYVRNDLDTFTFTPVMSGDGAAVLFKSNDVVNFHRFWSKDRSWEKLSFSDLSFDGVNPSAIALETAESGVVCSEKGLSGLKLPAKGLAPEAELTWTSPLAEGRCRTVVPFGAGQVLVGLESGGVIAFDTVKRVVSQTYTRPSGDAVIDIAVVGDSFKASSATLAHVYKRGKAEPVLETPHVGYMRLSASGKTAIIPISATEDGITYRVLDLVTETSTIISCSCAIGDFDADDNLIMLEGGGAVVRARDTGAPIRRLATFEKAPNSLRLLPGGKLVAAFRALSPATILPLDGAQIKPLVDQSSAQGTLLSSAAFLDNASVATVWDRPELAKPEDLDKGGISSRHTFELYDVGGGEGAAPSFSFGPVNAYADTRVTAHGLVFLTLQDSPLKWPRRLVVLDPVQKTTVLDQVIVSPFEMDDAGDTAILETADDLLLFDLASRKVTSTELAKGAPSRTRFWFHDGKTLVSVNNTVLKSVDFGRGAPQARPDLALGGYGNLLCFHRESQTVSLINVRDKRAFLQRWSLETRSLLHELEINRGAGDVFQVIADAEMWADRKQLAETVSCTAETYQVANLIGQAARWDIAGKTVGVVTLPAVAPVDDGDDEAIDPPPTDEELVSTVFTFTERRAELRGVDGRLLARFEADGARFVSGDYLVRRGIVAMGLENGELRAWRVRHADAPIIQLKLHDNPIKDLDASPDETRVMTADLSGVIYVLPIPELEELERAVAQGLP